MICVHLLCVDALRVGLWKYIPPLTLTLTLTLRIDAQKNVLTLTLTLTLTLVHSMAMHYAHNVKLSLPLQSGPILHCGHQVSPAPGGPDSRLPRPVP